MSIISCVDIIIFYSPFPYMLTTVRIMPKINMNRYKIKNGLSVWSKIIKSSFSMRGVANSSKQSKSLFLFIVNPFLLKRFPQDHHNLYFLITTSAWRMFCLLKSLVIDLSIFSTFLLLLDNPIKKNVLN